MHLLKVCVALLASVLTVAVLHAESRQVEELREDTINLSEATTWVSKGNAIVSGRVVIITHGVDFTWQVSGDLKIQQALNIISFTDEEIAANVGSIPPTPTPAPGGRSFDPGPNSEGCGIACAGQSGGAGTNGTAGQTGAAGRRAGKVIIVVTGTASGQLSIIDRGTNGGPGGRGGDGGPGGNGQQGGRAQPNFVLGSIPAGCKAGPGPGGNGGNGGAGGAGGNGGRGGDGGDIVFVAAGNAVNLHLTYSTAPGAPGPPGLAGMGGPGGRFGFGGRGSQGCEGRESDRRGADGASGPIGPPGLEAPAGKAGSVTFNPDTLATNRL
jgi:hypothetical protein